MADSELTSTFPQLESRPLVVQKRIYEWMNRAPPENVANAPYSVLFCFFFLRRDFAKQNKIKKIKK